MHSISQTMEQFKSLFLLVLFLQKEILQVIGDHALYPNTYITIAKYEPRSYRIVDGELAIISDFPYMVYVHHVETNGMGWDCGGALVTKAKVITAAHCVGKNEIIATPQEVYVYGGSAFKNVTNMTQFLVEKVSVHPQFSFAANKIINDIAVLTLQKPIEEYENVKPIEVATIPPKEGENCIVSGWGYTNRETMERTMYLLYTNVTILNHDYCAKIHRYLTYLPDKMLCAQRPDKLGDFAVGDSGGPLVCNKKLAGVVSWHANMTGELYPGVYMSVAAFSSWLKNISVPTYQLREGSKSKSSSKLYDINVLLTYFCFVYCLTFHLFEFY